jgi:hypothetical protein
MKRLELAIPGIRMDSCAALLKELLDSVANPSWAGRMGKHSTV